MFKLLTTRKYPTEMLYFLTDHTFIIYVQFIIGSTTKTSSLLEKSFKNDSIHYISDSISKRLKFDYSSSETALNRRIKFRAIF